MPIYEYQCGACGNEVEILQKLSDDPARECPDCGKMKLQRNVSAAGFRLAGSGWYETDFKKDGRKNLVGDKEGGSGAKSESGSSSSSADSGKDSGNKTQSKSDGKSDSKSGGKDKKASSAKKESSA